jgi:tetratricopeptide (TPR) repeat protein
MGGKVRVRRAWFLVVAASLTIVVGAEAQAGRAEVREGNRLYEEGRFSEAHEKYLEGAAAAPESGVIRFNDGNALYRGEDYERAAEAYQRAMETGDAALASQAWYNLGNALYRQQQLEESLEAFKQSLRLNPADSDAKHNLERVLEQLQQQQDQQDQQNQDEQDQQDQQNQDQQQGDQSQDQQQGEPPPQDQQQDPGDDEGSGEQPDARREPGEMTREEAERLLDAIDENPEDVDRRRAAPTGRRPLRTW